MNTMKTMKINRAIINRIVNMIQSIVGMIQSSISASKIGIS